MRNTVHLGDSFDYLRSVPDKTFDALITDPPYGLNLKDWDTDVCVDQFLSEAKRVTKDFVVFFGQFPKFAPWLAAANHHKLHPLEHVSWVKRNEAPVHKKRLTRTHEEVFFFAVGDKKTFYQVRGSYSDVKVPGVLVDVSTLESISRRISYLESWIKSGKQPVSTDNNRHQGIGGKMRFHKSSNPRNADTNFSNAWSFSPPKQSPGRRYNGQYNHPCEKPVEVMKRILEMTTLPGHLICDPFAGSGSTLVAAKQMGIDFVGVEQSPEYYEVIQRRLDEEMESKTEQLGIFQ